MAKMIELDFNPDARTLRQFGFIALVGFGFVAAIAWFEVLIFSFGLGSGRPWVAGTFAGLALLSGLLSVVYPKANRWIYVGLAVITYPIGFVLSYVIMGLLFFGIIAPTSLALRIVGHDPMCRRYDPDAPSYWSACRTARAKSDYFKQF
jgi:hypothetical protein